MLNRIESPERHSIQHISLIAPEQIDFENGLKAFVFRAPEQQLVKAEFIFQNLFTAPENPILHTCLSHMMKEGTATRTSAQIAEEIDFYGGYLMPEYSFDQTSLTLYTLQKHLSAILPVAHDVLNNALFPEAELQTYIRNNKQTLQISLQKNDYVARRLFYSTLFGKTRYGVTPTVESYEDLNREALLALYSKQIQPQNCTLILSGNITDEVINEMRDFFDRQWSNNGDLITTTAPDLVAVAPQTIIEERSDSLQSAIRIGMRSVNRKFSEYPKLQFVNTLFGGYFGSRLMRNIREDKGYTYSIGSAFASLKHSGFFTIATEVGVDSTKATLTEIEKEMNILRESKPTQQEVDLVKNYMLGSMLGSLESIFSHADKFKSVYFYGMDLDYFSRYNQTVQNMTPEAVQHVAQELFNYDNLLKIVVGKVE